ncbi:MAG: hypothetical protein HZC22_09945 [Rhodocyclales bacterium]|nr:hypothetical protein [Rhodocyclales bacterium]
MRRVAFILLVLGLAACTTISDMRKPERPQYFVLEKDYVRTQIRGLANVKHTEGLRAGKYTAVAEDDDGTYFQGAGRSVILLYNEYADAYNQTGQISESTIKADPGVLSVGGLWLPKPNSNMAPRLFYPIHNPTDGSKLGAVGILVVKATEGALAYRPFESERAFTESIRVISE